MNFKSIIIICALYFVTVTQSIGLNAVQIYNIGKVYDNKKSDLSNEDINKIGKVVDMNMSKFVIRKSEPKAQKLQAILVFLANNDKTTDDFMKPYLSSLEVILFVDLFSKYDFEGLLISDDVIKVIDALDLENWNISPQFSVKNDIVNCFHPFEYFDDKNNVLNFLNRMNQVKPRGSGIDQTKVQKLLNLRGNDPTINNTRNNPSKVTEYLKTLNIIKMDFEGQISFASNRLPYLDWQELLVLTAEYGGKNSHDGTVYSTSTVRNVLTAFSKFDNDKDGLLSEDEVSKMGLTDMSLLKRILSLCSPRMTIKDTNGDQGYDILELFMALFKAGIDLSNYDATVNPHYND